MSPVIEYTDSLYIKNLDAANKFQAIEELARVFEKGSFCSDIESLINALKEREEIMSTGIGFGIAIPHAKINAVMEMAFAIGISRKGIDFDSMDGQPKPDHSGNSRRKAAQGLPQAPFKYNGHSQKRSR